MQDQSSETSLTVDEVAVRLHRRQFVIGPEPLSTIRGWVTHELAPHVWVSHCPELRTAWMKDADGAQWGILGLAVESYADRPDPISQIRAAPTNEVGELHHGWAGRWILVGPEIHPDAAGLLGCFFGHSSGGAMWASSSPALLSGLIQGTNTIDPRRLRYDTGVSWYPPPRSRIGGMRRLLPSQSLQMPSGNVLPRPLLPPIDPAMDCETALDRLRDSLVTTIRRLPREGRRIWMSLSAGGDSRVVLAAAHLAGVKMTAFTRMSGRMSLADRLLPPDLAAAVGIEHVCFRTGVMKRPPGRLKLVMEHCADHVSPGDALPMVQGVRDTLEGISIGGQCFGVGKLLGRNLPDDISDPQRALGEIAQAIGEPEASTAMPALAEWLEWVAQTPHPHLDWRDRFYIEQRLAGWQSSKEQVYDLARLERFPVINAARNYALLLSMPPERRKKSRHHREMIERSVPQLMKHPFNPMDRDFGILRAIVLKTRDDLFYLPRKVIGEIKLKLRRQGGSRGH